MSYAQLAGAVIRAASVLYDMGLRKGDRVAVMLPNCPDFVISYYLIAGGLRFTGPLFL